MINDTLDHQLNSSIIVQILQSSVLPNNCFGCILKSSEQPLLLIRQNKYIEERDLVTTHGVLLGCVFVFGNAVKRDNANALIKHRYLCF